ncbi:MAG: hypothetical protein KY434_02740 [Actinobacteria bacterium]|nr:hypothetical protein [Actinomycetota bacterium]
MCPAPGAQAPRLGAWVRVRDSGLVGVVVAVGADGVTVFSPGDRRMARVDVDDAERVPAGAVSVSLSVELPLAHGVDEATLRRWLAVLADDVLRGRATDALRERELDTGPTLPSPRLDIRPVTTSGAVCLCGARTPATAPDGGSAQAGAAAAPACARCGRQTALPPA